MMKKNILLVIVLTLTVLTGAGKKRMSVLGDSYSTFGGYVTPDWNLCWYNGTDGGKGKTTDVDSVDQTWWRILADSLDWIIDRNNSFSGSTVCCTGYRNLDYSDRAFVSRVNDLGSPDVIIILSGTNDSWARVPVGEYKYSDWTKPDLYAFRPAFAYMLERLLALYPDAQLVNVVNSELSDDITESQAVICGHYGVTNIQLHDIDKMAGHPSKAGMRSIAEQIQAVIAEQ